MAHGETRPRRFFGGLPAPFVFSLVAVVPLGLLLVARVVSRVNGSSENPRVDQARGDLDRLADAVRRNLARYPQLSELSEMTRSDADGRRSLDSIPRDPWDHEYLLRRLGKGSGFIVISRGPDGIEGTEDDLGVYRP